MTQKESGSGMPMRRVIAILVTIGALYGFFIYALDLINEYQSILKDLNKNALGPEQLAGVLGTQGDYFGGLLNPFLAFFSLIALLYTIYLQTNELSLTRKEMEKTTKFNEDQALELRKQVEAAERAAELQANVSRQQQFDTTFSTLLAEHGRVLNEISKDNDACAVLNGVEMKLSIFGAREQIHQCQMLCKYYRVLYQLLKYIARNHPENTHRRFDREYLSLRPSDDEKVYSSLVRSMIPHDVLKGLAANSAWTDRADSEYCEYILLIERYAMLEHLHMENALKKGGKGIAFLSLETGATFVYRSEAFGTNTSLSFVIESWLEGFRTSHTSSSFDRYFSSVPLVYYESSVIAGVIGSKEFSDYKERVSSLGIK
ncbi:putative phage abortive infection protein [Enterovibrio calviensis]|uniref:putative phage abortive infection protein n=1 Tax=Enterovibrio calviensis TaxID=91359 RepID=UPI000487F49B|nr:putative phage abortive infection protein [Enterovibrio calviensis]